jgi:4-hydroxybenzoate polyprenyltransferase
MRYFRCLYLFTVNDFKVILIPPPVIGLALASTGPLLTTNSEPSFIGIIQRAPAVALWNWLNVLVFNIANQCLPDSVIEDSTNKPWRPIPSGLITPEEARRLLVALVLLETCVFTYIGGVVETFIMLVLTWMYNDLGGGNDSVFVRHLLNGLSFALHTYASIMMAANEQSGTFTTSREVSLSRSGWVWLFMEACIVITTIHAQDMPDIDGDMKRGRRTLPLLLIHGLPRLGERPN